MGLTYVCTVRPRRDGRRRRGRSTWAGSNGSFLFLPCPFPNPGSVFFFSPVPCKCRPYSPGACLEKAAPGWDRPRAEGLAPAVGGSWGLSWSQGARLPRMAARRQLHAQGAARGCDRSHGWVDGGTTTKTVWFDHDGLFILGLRAPELAENSEWRPVSSPPRGSGRHYSSLARMSTQPPVAGK